MIVKPSDSSPKKGGNMFRGSFSAVLSRVERMEFSFDYEQLLSEDNSCRLSILNRLMLTMIDVLNDRVPN